MAKKKISEMPTGYRFIEDVIPDLNYVIDKRKSSKAYYAYFLDRLLEMFEYKRLPDTIPHEIYDKYTMVNGISCITKDPDSQLRVFYGQLGGRQECYYRPTRFIISNPHFKETFSKECIVLGDEEHDGVLMRNDSLWLGLHPMLSRYSCLLAENTLTLRVADVLLRITSMLSAPTDKEKASAEEFLRSIENGELGVIAENAFFDGVKMQNPPSNNGSYLTQFIELQQYYKGSFFNEIGLSANYNMKREAIGKGESTLDQDALLPLCENMLKTRREDFAKVNEMFGTNIEVDFSSSWKENLLEAKLILLKQAEEAGLTYKSTSAPVSQLTSNEGDGGDVEKSGDELSQDESGGDKNGLEETDGTRDIGDRADTEDKVETGADDEPETETADGTSDDAVEGDGEKNINDLSVDETLDKLDDILDESISQLTAEEPKPTIMEGGNDDEFKSLGERTSDSKEDISGQ